MNQLADPNTKPILELFAKLSDQDILNLVMTGCLKWRYADLPSDFQRVYRDALEVNLEAARNSGAVPPPTMSLAALDRAEVGFAVVDIPDQQARVVSWFILLPEHPAPIWVTVVNARHAGTPEYFAAHQAQLNALRTRPLSALPTATDGDERPSVPRELPPENLPNEQ